MHDDMIETDSSRKYAASNTRRGAKRPPCADFPNFVNIESGQSPKTLRSPSCMGFRISNVLFSLRSILRFPVRASWSWPSLAS